jgi:hypothetical protein
MHVTLRSPSAQSCPGKEMTMHLQHKVYHKPHSQHEASSGRAHCQSSQHHSNSPFGLFKFQVLGINRSSCCWSVESQAKPSRSRRRHITTSAMASLGEELLNIVNRLQDLVFNTIGNDSLDLPQIVRFLPDEEQRQMMSF